MTTSEKSPTPAELYHHGVLGMKWGHRKKATGTEIRSARKRLAVKQQQINVKLDKITTTKRGTAERKNAIADANKAHNAYLKDPDRVVAVRMTRGEKAVALLFAGPTAGVSLASIAASSAASRRIEQKQNTGGYKKK